MTSRKTPLAVLALAALVSTAALAAEDAKGLPMIGGEVTKVDASAGKMTIKHEPITNLDMGAMTMVFKAGDPALLANVQPGDKIKFTADKVNGQITVMSVEKAK